MTAEVIVMNKYGLAMAADTVLTVATRQGPKLYRNLTKLFHLAREAPVAVMVYGSVEFSHLPWEVLIKDYRDRLGDRTFGSLEGFGSSFIEYLHGVAVDEDNERDIVLNLVFAHFSDLARQVKARLQEGLGDTSLAARRNLFLECLSEMAADLEQRPTCRPIEIDHIAFARRFRREIHSAREQALAEIPAPLMTREARTVLWRLAYLYMTKDVFSGASSGVVIAGFGDDQLLPSALQYGVEGKVCGAVKHHILSRSEITNDNQAIVRPFAQSDMVQRFMGGVDRSYNQFMDEIFTEELAEIADLMLERFVPPGDRSPATKEELEEVLRSRIDNVKREAAEFRQESFTRPIIDALRNAPKYELAELAESLVELASLKKRMSTDVESVGKPIDVALLSKSDGFSWVQTPQAHDRQPIVGIRQRSVEAIADPQREWHRQTHAILFAGIPDEDGLAAGGDGAGSRRTTETLEFARSLVADYGGQLQHGDGHGVLALFDTAATAARYALAIQDEARSNSTWVADQKAAAFCIGIDVGGVRPNQGKMLGDDTSLAFGIHEITPPGATWISDAAENALRGTTGLTTSPLDARHLTGVAEPVPIFALNTDEDPAKVGMIPHEASQDMLQAPGASIAVLPLDNLSGDPGDSVLCDGFTGDIITNLSRFRELMVIARHSAFQFRNRDLSSANVGRQLGVRFLLTGGLQRSGNSLRLRVQLSEADNDRVIWSERYDGDLSQLFAFQDDVTSMIAARLAIKIATAERNSVAAESHPDLQAYGLILRGQELGLRFRKETNLHARRLFEQAATIDPRYGRSYAGMSRTFNLAWRYHWAPSPEAALDQAVDLACEAISHDGFDARGYGELGFARLYKKEHDESLAAYHQAIELNPNDADLLAEMGDALTYCGQTDKAVDLIKRAMRLNPYYPDWYLWYLGEAYFYAGDYEQAIQTLKQMRDQSEAHRLLASSYAHLGSMEEASYHAKEVLRIHPNFSLEHWRSVPPNKDQRENDIFVDGLRKAGLR